MVVVVAESIPLAHLRCIVLEHRARLAWRVTALQPTTDTAMEEAAAQWLADRIDRVEAERTAWPYEDYQLVTSTVESELPESDLFAGITED